MSTEAKEPTTEELRAQAIAGEKAPETPPIAPEPAPDEAFTLTEGENGQVELKLRTGEVFKGTPLEVAKLAAKAKVDTTDYSRDLKTQLKDLQDRTQHISDALTPKPPAPTPEEVNAQQLREFLANQQAEYLGYSNAETMRQELADIRQTTAQSRSDRIAMNFMSECPDFPGTKEASDKLLEAGLANDIFRINDKGEIIGEPTAKQLASAHKVCVQDGIYKPLTQEEIQQQVNAGMRVASGKIHARPTPPPMVPGTQPETVQGSNNDPWSMPLGDLRQQIISGQRR